MKLRLFAALSLLATACLVGGWTWDDRIVAASWVSGQFGW